MVVINQLVRFRGVPSLLKANYGLDHGGYAFASKFDIQKYVGAKHFPATHFLAAATSFTAKRQSLQSFAETHGYPFVLKPDKGYVGKGIFIVENIEDLESALPYLDLDYLVQAFVPGKVEFGLFYVRDNGRVLIPSINQKLYPRVIGDGVSPIKELVAKESRYTSSWNRFLKDVDQTEVLQRGEERILSFIGSNTLGSTFVDVSDIATDALRERLATVFGDAPGVNFSRLDVKATSIEAFKRGEFVIIEVNGIASQPTNILDAAHSAVDVLRIMHTHALMWVKVAHQHKHKEMNIMGWIPFFKETKTLVQSVEKQHARTA